MNVSRYKNLLIIGDGFLKVAAKKRFGFYMIHFVVEKQQFNYLCAPFLFIKHKIR